MQGLRDDFLAGAVLAGDEDVGVGGSDAGHGGEHRLHGGAVAIISGRPCARRMRFSASRRWARRTARWRSIWVRRMVSRRALSQGFWMKSCAPRRMASTATSTLAHAVMTMTGICASWALTWREQVEAFVAGGGVAGVVEVDEERIEGVRI